MAFFNKSIKKKTVVSDNKFAERMNRRLDMASGTRDKRPMEFRSSSLPFCPLLFIESLMHFKVSGPQTEPVSFSSDFYTAIGTALHSNWQNVLGVDSFNVKPFGSWVCRRTKKEWKDCFRPKKLIAEDGLPYDLRYDEIDMEYNGLSCHVDLIEYHNDTKDWIIWDLKTAGTEMIEKPDKSLPVVKNIFQIESYMCIFEHTFGIRPAAYGLLYQARESATKRHPVVVEWTDKRRNAAMKRLDRWIDGYKKAKSFLKIATPMLEDKKIKLGILTTALEPVIDLRACRSKDEYDRIMSPCMTYTNGCRHNKLCTANPGTGEIWNAIRPALDDPPF